jgi:hypothetical protein
VSLKLVTVPQQVVQTLNFRVRVMDFVMTTVDRSDVLNADR